MLRPYEGPWVREQTRAVGTGLETRTYGTDRTGQKIYSFNSLGFRGEDFDPDAERRIFVFGCSHTFGVGLNHDEVWHSHFRRLYAEHHGLAVERINLMNFSHGGASNDFITRQVLTQCAAARPDLALVCFTALNRTESHTSGKPLPIAPWMWRPWPLRVLNTLKRSWGRLSHAKSFYLHLREAHRYYQYYSDEAGVLNAVRNLLLTQYFCRSQGIEYLSIWTDYRRLRDPELCAHTAIAQLVDMLDLERVLLSSLDDGEVRCDAAVDRVHAGPRSHRRFAEICFQSYLSSRHSERGQPVPQAGLVANEQ